MSKIPQEAIEALDWANFDEIKLNREWLPNDQDLIYTAINAYNGEGDMDDDCLEQIIERLLLAWRRADAARAQGAEVAVKPLEWVRMYDEETYHAQSIVGRWARWEGHYLPPNGYGGVACSDPIAAAQADYEQRIRSALAGGEA